MLIKWFIKHQWKQTTRSTIFQKNIAVNIFLGLIVLLLFVELLAAGLFLGDKWHTLFPEADPVTKFNGILLYYFAFDLIIRLMMQNVPVMAVQPYLHLPIKKSTLVNYMLSKALLSVFNYFPLLVFIPIAIFQIAPAYGSNIALIWIVSVFLLMLNNNYLLVYLKKQMVGNAKIVGISGLFLIAVLVGDNYGLISLSNVSALIFDKLILNPIGILIPIALLAFTYILNFNHLLGKLYPEELRVGKDKKIDTVSDIKYLKRLGQIGEIVGVEIKLFIRHKRTKSIMYMTPLFLLYGLFFYPQPEFQSMSFLKIFIGWFITGGLMYNYLNFAFSYESNYFDAILTHDIDMRRYFRMKFIVALLISSFCFIVTIPYVFFGADILLFHMVMYLFNIGVLSFALLYLATYNTNRMDLSKSATFNYQGMGASNWLSMIPAMLIPVLIFVLFNSLGWPYIGLGVLSLLGILGLLFNRTIIDYLVKQFLSRKYKMAEGFRKR